MKPLASWTRDLVNRIEQLSKWFKRAQPPLIYWISGFMFPTGFLTAVLQRSARQNNVSFFWFFLKQVFFMTTKHSHLYIILGGRHDRTVVKFVSDLRQVMVSSTNKTDHHDIIEILLKVVLNTLMPILYSWVWCFSFTDLYIDNYIHVKVYLKLSDLFQIQTF